MARYRLSARLRRGRLAGALWLLAGAARGEDTVVVAGDGRTPGTETRARSEVKRADIEERLPRSAPDALRYEPGVFVQQTSHGQGAPFVRGRYGARVLVVYDGIRLNNSTFRQGPNQYFFTLDAQTIRSIEVTRGGASTLYGTDALGGAIATEPMTPERPEPGAGFEARPRGRVQYRSADDAWTLRAQSEVVATEHFAALAGVGYTTAGQLRSAGPVRNPSNNGLPEVPRFAPDGVTQLGTGYRILTGDLNTRTWLRPGLSVVAAANVFRQYDTPRTDQCPPPFGLLGDCTTIDEQFRTLAYVGLDGDLGPAARVSRLRLSYQRQHERRTRVRPISSVENGGRDDVNTLGASASLQTDTTPLGPLARLGAVWGGDLYRDSLGSAAWVRFTNNGRLFPYTRGQYLDGSTYLTGGAFARGQLDVADRVTITLGGRAGLAQAQAPADPEGGTVALDRTWATWAAEARTSWHATGWLTLIGGVDRSFRAPNLDDLTSRQQTGPGFQFDNPGLAAESQLSTELGAVITGAGVRAEVWGFRTRLSDSIESSPRSVQQCPPGSLMESCASSWSRYQVVNAPGPAFIHGVEGALRVQPARFFRVQATASWTHGEGPNLGGSSPWGVLPDPSPRVPLARIPPANGTVETRWGFLSSFYAGWALRWALAQTRLAVSDRSDYRIPNGGTPGYAVFDLRAGYRFARHVIVNLAVENVMNRAYRSHGSGVNGAGRGVALSLEIGR